MRSLGHLFQQKQEQALPTQSGREKLLDAKTIFFLFSRIVREFYGKCGGGVIHPAQYEKGVLSIKVASPLWANELLIQEKELCRRINQEVGSDAVLELRILHGLHADE